VLLVSALLAAVSPAAVATGHQFCLNSADLRTPRGDAGQPVKKPALHCPICVGNHLVAVPPPAASGLHLRVAVVIAPVFPPGADLVAPDKSRSHQARAPPRLS
jgi:hypothetical protein